MFSTTLHLLNIPSKLNMSLFKACCLKNNTSPQGPRVDTCTQPTEQGPKNQLQGGILNSLVVFKPGGRPGSRPRSRLRPRPPRLGWLEVEAQRKQRPRLPGPPNYHSQRSQGLSHPPQKRRLRTREATNSCLVYLLAD